MYEYEIIMKNKYLMQISNTSIKKLIPKNYVFIKSEFNYENNEYELKVKYGRKLTEEEKIKHKEYFILEEKDEDIL